MPTVSRFTTCSCALLSFAIKKALGNGCSSAPFIFLSRGAFSYIYFPSIQFYNPVTTWAGGAVQLDRYLKIIIKMGCLDVPSRKNEGGERQGLSRRAQAVIITIPCALLSVP